jgi:hypothetical protein
MNKNFGMMILLYVFHARRRPAPAFREYNERAAAVRTPEQTIFANPRRLWEQKSHTVQRPGNDDAQSGRWRSQLAKLN